MKRAMIVGLVLAVGGVAWAQEKKEAEKPAETTPAAPTAPANEKPVAVDATKKEQIEAAMDKQAVVTGVVESARWTASGKTFILTFKDAPEDFRLRGYGKDKEALDKKFGGDAAANLLGKKVEVTGPITKYKGSVENWHKFTDVTVNSADQIKVVEEKKE